MSATIAVDVDALLAPVAGPSPTGPDLRYHPIYDEIKTARKAAEAIRDPKEDQEADTGDVRPWKKVADLSSGALAKSKDLQLGIWLLEALAHVDGYRGLSTGLVIIRRLVVEYWEGLYPPIDPEDSDPLAFRTALLSWIDERLPPIIKVAPLTAPPISYGVLHYEVTLRTGEEKKALLDEGKWPSSERFEQALHAGTLAHLERVLEEILTCQAELAALQAMVDQRYSAVTPRSETPSFFHLKETFETAHHLVERPTKKKRAAQAPAQAAAPDGSAPVDSGAGPADRNGDQVWNHALTLTRDSRLDGLRLLQGQVATAVGGRDRFLKELQLAELCLEASVHALAYPIFDELARTIETRRLEEWEDRALVARVWKGLVLCCGLLETQIPTAGARGKEIQDRLASLDPGPAAQP